MDSKVIVMGVTRVIFGLLSLSGGLLMFYFNDLAQSVRINGILGSIGPFVFISVSAIGLIGLSAQIDPRKLIMLVAGVILILIGSR
jgi:hypothetical protein